MKIVAVSACIAGIAHTYMAKAGLEKAAKEKGFDIKVECQGALGFENKLSANDIASADVAIFAVDTMVSEKDRFEGKKILKVGTNEVLKNSANIIERAQKLVEG